MADVDDDDVDGGPTAKRTRSRTSGRATSSRSMRSLDGATLRVPGGTGRGASWTGARVIAVGNARPARRGVAGLAPGPRARSRTDKNGREKQSRSTCAASRCVDDAERPSTSRAATPRSSALPPARASAATPIAGHRRAPRRARRAGRIDGTARRRPSSRTARRGVKLDALAHVALAPARARARSRGVHCLETRAAALRRRRRRSRAPARGRSLAARRGRRRDRRAHGRPKAGDPRARPARERRGPDRALQSPIRTFVLRAIVPGGAPAIGGNDAGARRDAPRGARARLGDVGSMRHQLRRRLASSTSTWSTHRRVTSSRSATTSACPRAAASVTAARRRQARRPSPMPARREHRARRALSSRPPSRRAGFGVTISSNARITPGASTSVDLSVRRLNGRSRHSTRPPLTRLPLSTDATLSVRSAPSISPTASSTSATWTRWRARSRSARS